MDEDELEYPEDPYYYIILRLDPEDDGMQIDIRGLPIIVAATALSKAAEEIYDLLPDSDILLDDPAFCSIFEDEEDD